jgi:hypothetical protein
LKAKLYLKERTIGSRGTESSIAMPSSSIKRTKVRRISFRLVYSIDDSKSRAVIDVRKAKLQKG